MVDPGMPVSGMMDAIGMAAIQERAGSTVKNVEISSPNLTTPVKESLGKDGRKLASWERTILESVATGYHYDGS